MEAERFLMRERPVRLREAILRCAGRGRSRASEATEDEGALREQGESLRIVLQALQEIGEVLAPKLGLDADCVDEAVSYTALRIDGLREPPDLDDEPHAFNYLKAALRKNLHRRCMDRPKADPPDWCARPTRALRLLLEIVIPEVSSAKDQKAAASFSATVRDLMDYVCRAPGSDLIILREAGWSEQHEPDAGAQKKAAEKLYQRHCRARRDLRTKVDEMLASGRIDRELANELSRIIGTLSLRQPGVEPPGGGGWG